MNNIYKYLALLNDKGQPSGHKLTGLAATIMLGYIHYKYIDKDNAVTITTIDWFAIMLCLGRVTFSQILEFKNGKEKQTHETN